MPSELVSGGGGGQPFVRRRIGISISMVGSIYNMGVWEKVAAAWVKAGVHRTFEGEAVARLHYQEAGLSLENGGCMGDPHSVVERCLVFLCIFHGCMAMGRLQVAFIQVRLGDKWPSLRCASATFPSTTPRPRVQYRARTGVRLGSSATPDGEEARALFLTWKEIRPLLAYAPEDGEWQDVVAMQNLLREL